MDFLRGGPIFEKKTGTGGWRVRVCEVDPGGRLSNVWSSPDPGGDRRASAKVNGGDHYYEINE